MKAVHCHVHADELPAWVDGERLAGTRAIQNCAEHRAPLCACWGPVRARLQRAAQLFRPASPEALAATEVLGELEWLERLPKRVRTLSAD